MKVVVTLSGGMDSSICLVWALQQPYITDIQCVSFNYGQRHDSELESAKQIANYFSVPWKLINLDFLSEIDKSSLTDSSKKVETIFNDVPSTLVCGRNGLFCWITSQYCYSEGYDAIATGVLERVDSNSGYRDCSRSYMDALQNIIRVDMDNINFKILTPLVTMKKAETYCIPKSRETLDFLFKHTVTCYNGVKGDGCGTCNSCVLRSDSIKEFRGNFVH